MKKLTIQLDEQTHTRFKSKAAADNQTMRGILGAAIEAYLAGKFKPAPKPKGATIRGK